MINIIPRGKYVLIRPVEASTGETRSGLIVPTNVEKEQRSEGTIEAVGPEIKDLKKGDHVIYGAYAGEEIKLMESSSKVDFRLVMDEDIIATVDDGKGKKLKK